ncbi:MAG: GtrA family protein [Paludibacteraceae bacterium]|nr:GtrA family protein [Paludibacteraceae bacterium]
MKTLSRRLPSKYRSVVRFICVGIIGTLLQYGLYYLFLEIFRRALPDSNTMASVAFSIGFYIEMIVNYFLTNYYTFHTHPSWKNAGGFIFGRIINYIVQMLFLNALLWLSMSEEWAGIVAIMLAGVLNYFVLLPFFRAKKKE